MITTSFIHTAGDFFCFYLFTFKLIRFHQKKYHSEFTKTINRYYVDNKLKTQTFWMDKRKLSLAKMWPILTITKYLKDFVVVQFSIIVFRALWFVSLRFSSRAAFTAIVFIKVLSLFIFPLHLTWTKVYPMLRAHNEIDTKIKWWIIILHWATGLLELRINFVDKHWISFWRSVLEKALAV